MPASSRVKMPSFLNRLRKTQNLITTSLRHVSEDVDNEVFQTIVAYYQSEGTAKVIEESSKGSQFPVWDEAK
jgi:ABC-type metal ion transport system substrate-binding protein